MTHSMQCRAIVLGYPCRLSGCLRRNSESAISKQCYRIGTNFVWHCTAWRNPAEREAGNLFTAGYEWAGQLSLILPFQLDYSSTEAEFMNVQFRWGSGYNLEISDLRFPYSGYNLETSDLSFPYTVFYITNQYQTPFAQGGGEIVKSVSRGDCE